MPCRLKKVHNMLERIPAKKTKLFRFFDTFELVILNPTLVMISSSGTEDELSMFFYYKLLLFKNFKNVCKVETKLSDAGVFILIRQ